jgi:hypothetical protein
MPRLMLQMTIGTRAIAQAVEAAEIKRSNRARRVGQYELRDLLAEGETRVRLYPYHLAATRGRETSSGVR